MFSYKIKSINWKDSSIWLVPSVCVADILEHFCFPRDQMEHIVSGTDEMHVSLMELTVWLCQPGEKCASCTGLHYKWWMGLNVSYIWTLYMSLLTEKGVDCYAVQTLIKTELHLILLLHIQMCVYTPINPYTLKRRS
jgi:hypothetical protein